MEGKILELLLVTHFPESIVTEEVAVPAAACREKQCNWQVTVEAVTYRTVEWVINSFSPYKIPGMDGIFPALLQQGRRTAIPYLPDYGLC